MTSPSPSSAPSAREFRASPAFIKWPAALVLLNLVFVGIALANKQLVPAPLFGAIGFAFLILLVSAATLRVTMDAEGLGQRWIWGRRRIGWHQVASIERTKRGRFLLDEKNKEIFAVSALPLADQEVITAEAIKRGRLRKDKKASKPPVLERWVQK